MSCWEYRVVTLYGGDYIRDSHGPGDGESDLPDQSGQIWERKAAKLLNRMGAEQWELDNSSESLKVYRFYFKRGL